MGDPILIERVSTLLTGQINEFEEAADNKHEGVSINLEVR